MSIRFAAAVVAFAVSTALVAEPHLLPEFLVQLRDPNVLGGPLFSWVLEHCGYAALSALCAVLVAGSVLLVAWRTRVRGAPDQCAALAACLAAICLAGRLGVSLDPIGWFCAAALAVALERSDRRSIAQALAVVACWSLLQGGASLAAIVCTAALVGAIVDARRFDAAAANKAIVAAGAVIAGGLQLHAAPWHAYGAHALYLDALAAGAQRDRLWNGGFALPAVGFSAMAIFAGWYGVRRRSHCGDAVVFFALFLLSLADARNVPFFGIFGAPIVADAAASFYVGTRTVPRGSIFQYAAAFAVAAFAFVAITTATQPKAVVWPVPYEQAASLIVALAKDRRMHYVLCEQPRWCDGADLHFANVRTVLDDRTGIAPAFSRRVQADAVATHGAWRSELARVDVDAVIAKDDANIVSLLAATGWRQRGSDGARVLLLRPRAR